MKENETNQGALKLPPKQWLTWEFRCYRKKVAINEFGEPYISELIEQTANTYYETDPRIALTMIVRAWENEVKRMAEKRWRGAKLKPTITSQQKDKIFDAYGKLCDRHEDAEAQFKGWDALLRALELKGEQ